jgi:hypothetical protein
MASVGGGAAAAAAAGEGVHSRLETGTFSSAGAADAGRLPVLAASRSACRSPPPPVSKTGGLSFLALTRTLQACVRLPTTVSACGCDFFAQQVTIVSARGLSRPRERAFASQQWLAAGGCAWGCPVAVALPSSGAHVSSALLRQLVASQNTVVPCLGTPC